jgi:hypothetical protein
LELPYRAVQHTGKRDEATRLLTTVVANKAEFGETVDARKLLDQPTKG